MSREAQQFKTYITTYLVPAVLFSLGIVFLLYLFDANGVSFRRWKQYLDKEVVIEADGATPSCLAPKPRRL